jgi:hypothetical protein
MIQSDFTTGGGGGSGSGGGASFAVRSQAPAPRLPLALFRGSLCCLSLSSAPLSPLALFCPPLAYLLPLAHFRASRSVSRAAFLSPLLPSAAYNTLLLCCRRRLVYSAPPPPPSCFLRPCASAAVFAPALLGRRCSVAAAVSSATAVACGGGGGGGGGCGVGGCCCCCCGRMAGHYGWQLLVVLSLLFPMGIQFLFQHAFRCAAWNMDELHPSHCHTGAQRTLLWAAASAARRMPLRPCSTPAPPLHTPPHHLPPFPAWRACTPVTRMQHECSTTPCLSTPQRSTRGVAPRNNAARAAKATMDLFQKTNEM